MLSDDQAVVRAVQAVPLHSAGKFIGGRSDVLAGMATTRSDVFLLAPRNSRELPGATQGTLECFLTVRGARTMALQLERAQQPATHTARPGFDKTVTAGLMPNAGRRTESTSGTI